MDSRELRKIKLFKNLSNESLKKIHSMLEQKSLRADEVLFYEGDIGDELIIIEKGQVAIFSMGVDQTHQIIRIFEAGESLGEMALIDEKPRSLGAKAVTESEILTLNKKAFIKLLSSDDPEIAFALMKELSARVRYTTEFLNKVKAWVQIISKGNYENALNQAKAQ